MTEKARVDQVDTFQGATIQHGAVNNRVYLMKIGNADPVTLGPALCEFAREKGYTKIFAKLPASNTPPFLQAGFVREAAVPRLYQDAVDGHFLGYFLDATRRIPSEEQKLRVIRQLALSRSPLELGRQVRVPECPAGMDVRVCGEGDVEQMAVVYGKVFASYPFPITEPDYLLKTMKSHVIYVGAWEQERLIALASAEMDTASANAELTDFVTLPERRGRGLAGVLLHKAEQEAMQHGIHTAFTIARAVSAGMNISFARGGYFYGGMLVNNTEICGRIESMNVWYKLLG